jgi:hypothetical protein
MRTLTSRTLAILVRLAEGLTRKDMVNLLLAAELDRFNGGGYAKGEMFQDALRRARQAAEEEDDIDAHRGLRTLVEELATATVRNPESESADPDGLFAKLREALLASGYELSWERRPVEPQQPRHWLRSQRRWLDDEDDEGIEVGPPIYRLRPTEAPSADMAREITALEVQLRAAGLGDALHHYRQAVDNLANHNYEAANGQLRTMLEDLFVQVARSHAGYTGLPKGGAAVHFMVEEAQLLPKGWGRLLQGAWDLSHAAGSHPGRSSADEARFRMVIFTSLARRLLQHVDTMEAAP